MKIGDKYNWKNQAERLVYMGKQGNWHQFSKVGEDAIWCEVLDRDMCMLEETVQDTDSPSELAIKPLTQPSSMREVEGADAMFAINPKHPTNTTAWEVTASGCVTVFVCEDDADSWLIERANPGKKETYKKRMLHDGEIDQLDSREIAWTEDTLGFPVHHSMSVESATAILQKLYTEWPGGLDEIEAQILSKNQTIMQLTIKLSNGAA